MTARVASAALVVLVVAGLYFVSRSSDQLPAEAHTPPHEESRALPPAPAAPIAGKADATSSDAGISDTERATNIKNAMSAALAARSIRAYIGPLTGSGLAPADSERIAEALLSDLAGCMFEAARQAYTARGVTFEEFLNDAEGVWLHGPEESRTLSVSNVVMFAPSCAAGALQQAGIPARIEPNNMAPYNGRRREVVSVPQSAEMETRVLSHISQYPEIALTNLQVQCDVLGCTALLEATTSIDIFLFEFDRFAEENGFASAVISGSGGQRIVHLRL